MRTSRLDNGNSNASQDKQIRTTTLPNLPPFSQAPSIPTNTETSPTGQSLPAYKGISSDGNLSAGVYEGYQFFKADPFPGQKATWTRVDRTKMHFTQSELYKLVQKRANKISAAQQYQNLSETRRAHVNQLIHEQRKLNPSVEWSCVYAKERDRPSKARNARRDDYETVSMDIILMKRPLKTKLYPRTPMGDLVDLNAPFRPKGIEAHKINNMQTDPMSPERLSDIVQPRYQFKQVPAQPLIRGTTTEPGCVVQELPPCPLPVTSPFHRLDLNQGITMQQLPSHASQEQNYLKREPVDWTPESDTTDGDDDGSTMSDDTQSDMTSIMDEEGMDYSYEEPLRPHSPPRKLSRSPTRRDSNLGAHRRRRSNSRHIERRDKWSGMRYPNIEMLPVSHLLPARRARSSRTGIQDPMTREMRYRVQRTDEEELRNRLLDCEAKLEQWERIFERQNRMLQKNVASPPQLQRCQSFYDFTSMRHCGCACRKDNKMVDVDA